MRHSTPTFFLWEKESLPQSFHKGKGFFTRAKEKSFVKELLVKTF